MSSTRLCGRLTEPIANNSTRRAQTTRNWPKGLPNPPVRHLRVNVCCGRCKAWTIFVSFVRSSKRNRGKCLCAQTNKVEYQTTQPLHRHRANAWHALADRSSWMPNRCNCKGTRHRSETYSHGVARADVELAVSPQRPREALACNAMQEKSPCTARPRTLMYDTVRSCAYVVERQSVTTNVRCRVRVPFCAHCTELVIRLARCKPTAHGTRVYLCAKSSTWMRM